MSVGGACVRRRSASIAGVITKPRHRIHPTFQVNAGFKRYYIKALSIDSKGKVNQALGKAQALKFETEFGKYKLKRGPYANDNYWDLDASVKPPHMWWLDYGSGLLGKIGQGGTSKPCGSGAAERNWKLYKNIVTKKRNRMGELKVDTYADDAEDEMEIDQTTGTKLAFVSANLHCKKFDDYAPHPTSRPQPRHRATVAPPATAAAAASAPTCPLLAYHTPTGGAGATYKTEFKTAVPV